MLALGKGYAWLCSLDVLRDSPVSCSPLVLVMAAGTSAALEGWPLLPGIVNPWTASEIALKGQLVFSSDEDVAQKRTLDPCNVVSKLRALDE